MILPQEIDLIWLIALVPTAFMAGYIDAIAGGGGMLQLPMLLLSGMPPVSALATNKIASIFGTTLALIQYARKGMVLWKIVFWSFPFCLMASWLGGQSAMLIPVIVLEWLIVICIPLALLLVFLKPKVSLSTKMSAPFYVPLLSLCGFYDGILGPGTGSYMIIILNRFCGIDYLRATAIAKPLNLATNLGAAIAFIVAAQVLWDYALPMIISNMLGAWMGSHFAIKKGVGFIRRVLIFVLSLMLILYLFKLMAKY